MPALGVVASQEYCDRCRGKRRETAKRQFQLRRLSADDFDGPYLLPRALRKVR